jgi:DNA-directed RNA polymerase specialized sigma24 family protein
MTTIPSSSALARKERWTLTQDAFHQFLTILDPDPNRAGEKYEQIRKKLVSFFQWKRCGDAEHSADETIDRTIRKLAGSEVHGLVPFIWGIAKRVASEIHRRGHRDLSIDTLPELAQPIMEPEEKERQYAKRSACLHRCAKLLSEGDARIAVEWYSHVKSEKAEHKRKLAAALGVSVATLRVRAYRTRLRLRQLATEEMSGAAASDAPHRTLRSQCV